MTNVNTTQVATTVAPPVAFLAGLLAGKGVFGLDAATWTILLGALVTFASTVGSAVMTRTSALVQQALTSDKATVVSAVAAMPEVKEVKLDKSEPGAAALSAATPANVTSS